MYSDCQKDKDLRERTHAYLGGICRNLKCPALIVGGDADHVYLLTRHSKNIAIANFMGDIKIDERYVWD